MTRRSLFRLPLFALPVASVVAVALLLAAGGDAASERHCSGVFPPKRPELANFKVAGMPCWAGKLLIDEALEQRVGPKRKIVLLGFTCRFKPTSEASGVVTCAGRGASARADFAVF